MLISHECPISMLKLSKAFNDYDYALVHLFKLYPEYKLFFKNSDRMVILDNSIFELGLSYDILEFIKEANDIRASHIIVPDSLENKDETLRKLKLFNSKKHLLEYEPKIIAVVQGHTLLETLLCYDALLKDDSVDVIAISFDYSFYEKMFNSVVTVKESNNKYLRWAVGRNILMDLIAEQYNNTKDVHLLGCAVAGLFKVYKYQDKYNFIKSLDTSNPVVHGLLGIPYGIEGVTLKESVKLCLMITCKVSDSQRVVIDYNIKKFREMVNR